MLLAFAVSACSPTTGTLGADTLSALDDLRALVDDHVAAVKAATTVEEVQDLEASHHADMSDALSRIEGRMSDMMRCSMSGDMGTHLGDAHTHMEDMTGDVDAHGETQDAQAAVDGCRAEEDDYTPTMHDHVDAMESDLTGFDEDAVCPDEGGGMGMGM